MNSSISEKTKDDYSRRLTLVLEHIQSHLDNDLSLDELSQIACFSPYHFHRIFQGMTGESLKAYIRRLRLERAALQLKNGQRQVIQIALDAGYDSHEAFTRAFGNHFGFSPTQFRKDIQTKLLDSNKSLLPLWKELDMKVDIINFEETNIIYVRHVGPYNECGKAWEALCTWAGPKGMFQPGCQFLGLCYDDPEVTEADKIRYEACLSIDDPIEVDGEIGTKTLPAGKYAMATHFGPYEKLSETYNLLCGQWLPQHGYEIADKPSIEIYQNTPEDTEPEDLITDVYIPLA